MRHPLIACLLLTCLPVWADTASVSRQLEAFEKTTGQAQTAAANSLMQIFLDEEITDEAVQFGSDTPADTLLMQVWYWAADYFYGQQDYRLSVAYGQKALPLTRGTSWEADCLNTLAMAYLRQADYEQAAAYAKECYKLDEQTGDPDIMSSSLNTLAGIYVGANQPREAEQYILKAIELAEKADNPARMAVLQGTASEIYHQMGDDERALTYARRACQIEEQRGDLYKLAVRRTQLASVLIGKHDYAEAEQMLGDVMPVFRQVGDRHSLGIALNKLGMSLLCQERQPEAIPCYREAEGIFKEMGDLANEMHAQRGLYESYWTLNHDSAKLALDRFDLLKDSLYSNATAESMARFNAEFGTDWLHQENQRLRARVLTFIIGILVALLLAAAVWLWMRRRMHIREAALLATIAELQQGQEADSADASDEDATNELSDADREFLSRLVLLVKRDMRQADISVESLASELCITRGQLNRRIKAIAGVTTQKYVMHIRMEQARLLLTSHPDRSISEVAYQCGFSDPTSFSRAFRQTFGTSPTQFRNKPETD